MVNPKKTSPSKLQEYLASLLAYLMNIVSLFIIVLLFIAYFVFLGQSDEPQGSFFRSLYVTLSGLFLILILVIYISGVKYWLDKYCNSPNFADFKHFETITRISAYFLALIALIYSLSLLRR
jgi:hypothetical protein